MIYTPNDYPEIDDLATANRPKKERPRTIITIDPCTECAYEPRCKAGKLACLLFSSWLKTGKVRSSGYCKPSRAVYERCFA